MHPRHSGLNRYRWAVVFFLCVLAVESAGPRAQAASSAVVWIERVNVTVSGDVLQKTAGCDGCFDAAAISEQQITADDENVEFTVADTKALFIAGLNHGNAGAGYADIDFAFRLNGAGHADVLQNGTYVGGDTSYAVGDAFRIAVVGGTVLFSRNGSVVLERTTPVTHPLIVDTALATIGKRSSWRDHRVVDRRGRIRRESRLANVSGQVHAFADCVIPAGRRSHGALYVSGALQHGRRPPDQRL